MFIIEGTPSKRALFVNGTIGGLFLPTDSAKIAVDMFSRTDTLK